MNEPAQANGKTKSRDFGAELAALVGNPAKCLDQRTYESSLAPITIQISVQVMPSGEFGRVEVHSPTLAPAELECIKEIVDPLRLHGPIPGAPRGIQTSVKLQPQAAKPVAAEPSVPEQRAFEPTDMNEPAARAHDSDDMKERPMRKHDSDDMKELPSAVRNSDDMKELPSAVRNSDDMKELPARAHDSDDMQEQAGPTP